MSILLEALRKTEKDRNPVEVPDIHADQQQGSESDPVSMVPLATLLVVALFVSGWFIWRQYEPPAKGYQPPVTLAVDESRVDDIAVDSAATMKPEESGGQASRVSRGGSVGGSAGPAGGRPRTPVESYQQAIKAISNSGTKPAHDSNRATSATGGVPNQTVSSAPVAAKAATRKPKKQRRHEPAPIGYWELPDAIREDVPEIKFSVLVYANEPADRFVLVDGQRLAEGDSPQPGLVVKEIRRDGVVFSYRLYQFLIER